MTATPGLVTLDAATVAGLDLDGVQLIEASAGTGKTHAIADLYLRQVLGGRTPAQILLVTFTNAATEELRGRIRQRLCHAARVLAGAVDGDTELMRLLARQAADEACARQWLDRIEFALTAMDEAAISTIHGFCQRALQRYALTSGQFFDSRLLADDRALWEAAIKDWWRTTTYELDAATWALLREQLPDLEDLLKILLDLRNKPSATLLPEGGKSLPSLLREPARIAADLHALADDWIAARDQLADILQSSKALSRRQELPYKADKLPGLLGAADEFFGAPRPAARPFEQFEFLGCDRLHAHSTDKKRGSDPRLDHPFFAAIDRFARDWTQFKSGLRAALLIDARRESARLVERAKRETALLAYQDQLQSLRDALQAAGGDQLAASLRGQFPVAMIDEFQDTDSIQFAIFGRIYLDGDAAGLTLIGDPKQAIYSFRGGDIFTYIDARRTAGMSSYNLDVNWRSRPGLVEAVNCLFGRRPAPFVYDRAIGFHPARPNPDNARLALAVDGEKSAPLTLWRLPRRDDETNHSRDQMRERIYAAIAAEIVRLLQGDSRIDGEPLRHGDLAILVRSAAEGQALGRVLRRHGIPSVTISRESVFASDEARGLYELLCGVNQYQNIDAARRALASSLLRYDYRDIAAIVDDDRGWQAWVEALAAMNLAWQRQGFIPMFQRLMQRFEIAARLADDPQGERRLTNLLHLAELAQQQSTVLPGPDPLLGWFGQQFEADANDESELRLEGDESLVRIVTIHKSKGLQYPVVFVPFLWSCKPVNDRQPAIFFHREDASACIDFGSDAVAAHRRLAEKERLAEDLRLLYVALTRATSKVYLAWGTAGSASQAGYANQTALAWLLHSRQQPADLDHAAVDGFPDDMDFDADLAALAAEAGGRIAIEPLPAATPGIRADDADRIRERMSLARFGRGRLPAWKVASFTGLTRGMHVSAGPRGESEGDPILDFPAGSHVGLMLHSLLEHLDFAGAVDAQCAALLPRLLPRVGLEFDQHGALLTRWLGQVLQTPLDDAGLRLSALPVDRRLNELEFDFALDRFDAGALNRLLQARAGERLPLLTEGAFEGLINGVIDLVFEHRGRYYLADYKSNRLGPTLDAYARPALDRAMLNGRYDLQALLYALALHRYLGGRIGDYDYRRHFGGCYYLFLRGMRPDLGPSHGVHFDRPDDATLAALERIFRFTPRGSLR